jgi:hypothetical protein
MENPEGWLYRVAVNLSLSWRKQAFRRVLRNPPDQPQNAYSRKRRIRHSSSVVTGRTLIAFLRGSLQPNAAHASFDVFIMSADGSDQHDVTTQGEEGFSPFNPAGLSWEPEEHATPAADKSPASSAKASGASTPPVYRRPAHSRTGSRFHRQVRFGRVSRLHVRHSGHGPQRTPSTPRRQPGLFAFDDRRPTRSSA